MTKALIRKMICMLMVVSMLPCFVSCEESYPEDFYLGDWYQFNSDLSLRITEDGIYVFEDGFDDYDIEGPYDYIVSKDDNYTYLEINIKGRTAVAVVLNYDTISLCNPIDPDDPPQYTGITPNGIKFDATLDLFDDWFIRTDAKREDAPGELQEIIDALLEYPDEEGDGQYYYFANSCMAYFPETLSGSFYIGETTDGDYMLLDNAVITILGMNRYMGDAYVMKGNFVMVD